MKSFVLDVIDRKNIKIDDIVYNDLCIGKWSVYLQYGKHGYKFFLYPLKQDGKCIFDIDLLETCSLKKIEELAEIYEILSSYNLAPKLKEIFSFSFRNKKGYGLKVEHIILNEKVLSWKAKGDYLKYLRDICIKHKIVRWGTIENLIWESSKSGNYIYSENGFKVVDIDPRWEIK